MTSWSNEHHMLALMRAYLSAAGRLEEAESSGDDRTGELDQLRDAKRAAAEAFERALLDRGWQRPGMAIGPLARARRW